MTLTIRQILIIKQWRKQKKSKSSKSTQWQDKYYILEFARILPQWNINKLLNSQNTFCLEINIIIVIFQRDDDDDDDDDDPLFFNKPSIILLTIGICKCFEEYLNCFHTNQSQWRLTFNESQLCGRSLKSQRVITELLFWQIRKAGGFIASEKKEKQTDGGVLCTKSSESYISNSNDFIWKYEIKRRHI